MKNLKKLPVINKILIGTAITAAAGVFYLAAAQPVMFQSIEDKIKSIITPKPPIGTLTPARDITGVWKSSLSGKGMQLFGQFTIPGSITDLYEEGDIELIINDVTDNIASGQFRYTDLCAWGTTTVTIPGAQKIIKVPKSCFDDMGYSDIQIKVSSSALDFGTFTTGDITATMQGTFTTDLIHGSMTMTSPYGVLKGVFNLMREK